MHVTVHGGGQRGIPALQPSFAALLPLRRQEGGAEVPREAAETRAALLRSIEKNARWKEPTPVQMQAVPIMMDGRDILAAAPTGSGKTAAFVIPVLDRLRTPLSKLAKAHRQELVRLEQEQAVADASTTKKGKSKKGKSKKMDRRRAALGPTPQGPRALLLAPTRELAAQIYREAVFLSQGRKFRCSFLQKANASTAMREEQSGHGGSLNNFDILVATPLRLVSLLQNGAVDLSHVEVVVLDEADRLFDAGNQRNRGTDGNDNDDMHVMEGMRGGSSRGKKRRAHRRGDEADSADNDNNDEPRHIAFLQQVAQVLAACTAPQLQKALFSATIGPQVEELAHSFLAPDAIRVNVGVPNAGASTIDQRLVFAGREEGKLIALRNLVQDGLTPPVLIFVQSKERAKELFRELVYDGINVDVMHADRTQEQRDAIVRKFRLGEIWVLISTDLMARGIDFKGVNMVINYDLPQNPVAYIHRIGRTGRAGRRGSAITFFTESDMPVLRSIANVVKLSGCDVPNWMLTLPKLTTKQRRRRNTTAPDRRPISTKPRKRRRKGRGIEHGDAENGGVRS